MPHSSLVPVRKPRSAAGRLDDGRVLLRLAAAALDPDRPLIAHLVVTRRCNLACGYCTEYDASSPPVPTADLEARIDHLASLGTIFVTLTGGETLLHPDVVALVAHVRARGMVPVMNSNGFLLTRALIDGLDRAGLYALQLSVDGVHPNATTMKALKSLRPKLRLLAAHAGFHVRINTVLGACPPAEALEVARVALAHGFDAKCSLVRNPDGTMIPVTAELGAAYREIRGLGKRSSRLLSDDFQQALVEHGAITWKCRAGARFFHVTEDGNVHLCTPRLGAPGIPLAAYTVAHIRAASREQKACAARCPVPYAHQASRIDAWRAQPDPPIMTAPRARDARGRVHLAVR
jgi:MoaA/NifB/PqqE/SkfB family radical SAM enzyme